MYAECGICLRIRRETGKFVLLIGLEKVWGEGCLLTLLELHGGLGFRASVRGGGPNMAEPQCGGLYQERLLRVGAPRLGPGEDARLGSWRRKLSPQILLARAPANDSFSPGSATPHQHPLYSQPHQRASRPSAHPCPVRPAQHGGHEAREAQDPRLKLLRTRLDQAAADLKAAEAKRDSLRAKFAVPTASPSTRRAAVE